MHAATVTVINTNDSSPGSLRQALTTANDGDTITFAVTGTITVTTGGLPVTKNLTISGPGADQLSVDGNQGLLVFGIFPDKTAVISGLTVRNGQIGIWSEQATLALSNCVVSLNSVGGVLNDHAPGSSVTVINSTISGNSAGDAGGGISNEYGLLSIVNSTISGNSAQGGGGIENFEGSVQIANSTISSNSAGSGGGIENVGG